MIDARFLYSEARDIKISGVLHSASQTSESELHPWRVEKPIGVHITTAHEPSQLLVPWLQTEPYDVGLAAGQAPPKIELAAPSGFAVELRGAFPKRRNTSRTATEPEVSDVEFSRLVGDWIAEGCSEVEVRFGPMGKVSLTLLARRSRKPEPTRISDEEVERRVHQIGDPIPDKVTWDFIRRILEVEPKVPYRHHSVRGVTSRKQVRRVLRALRNKDVI